MTPYANEIVQFIINDIKAVKETIDKQKIDIKSLFQQISDNKSFIITKAANIKSFNT